MKIELPDATYSRLVNISKMISSTPSVTLRHFVDTMCETYEQEMMVMPDGTILDLAEAEAEILEAKLKAFEEGEGWRRGQALDDNLDT